MVVSLRELLDPCAVSDEEAVEIARQRAAQRESFGLELARYTGELMKAPQVPAGVAERSFTLIEVAGQPLQYLWLVRAGLAHDDAAIRMAAISLLKRQAKTPGWLQKLVADPDERVRAGTMEALWSQAGPGIERILMAACQDPSEMVAANAVYGLYLMNPERHTEALRKFAAHRIPAFRCAAAALVGRLQPAIRGPLLKPLLTDPDASVRRVAFQTLSAMKSGAQAAA